MVSLPKRLARWAIARKRWRLVCAGYDSCQHLGTVVRALDGLRFPPGFVLGVTWIEDLFSGPTPPGPLFALLSAAGSYECVAHPDMEPNAIADARPDGASPTLANSGGRMMVDPGYDVRVDTIFAATRLA